VLLDDCFHLVAIVFHVLDHHELRAAPVQIVVFPVNLEVDIARQMVRQEPHAAFEGH
jgi:hypothetical protein